LFYLHDDDSFWLIENTECFMNLRIFTKNRSRCHDRLKN